MLWVAIWYLVTLDSLSASSKALSHLLLCKLIYSPAYLNNHSLRSRLLDLPYLTQQEYGKILFCNENFHFFTMKFIYKAQFTDRLFKASRFLGLYRTAFQRPFWPGSSTRSSLPGAMPSLPSRSDKVWPFQEDTDTFIVNGLENILRMSVDQMDVWVTFHFFWDCCFNQHSL